MTGAAPVSRRCFNSSLVIRGTGTAVYCHRPTESCQISRFWKRARRTGNTASVRHRVQNRVDAKRVARRREPQEIPVVVAFPFEGVTKIGVVGHHDHDAPAMVEDRAHMRLGAVDAALGGGAASPDPEI